MIIRCMNVKFSPNLGDGLLSECLEAALIKNGAASDTSSVDLAAREEYGDTIAGRGMVMSVLDALPADLRHLVVRAPLALQARRKWGPHYDQGLAGADAVAIGGGNLLSDHDLNFPTKLSLALRTCHRHDVPVAIYACGMAKTWSAEGHRRMQSALETTALADVFLRDAESKERWDVRFAPICGKTATVVRDPGLLACDIYPQAARAQGAAPVIGLGIMSHVAIRYHGAGRLSADALGRWYIDLARSLIKLGARVVAFTNGSPEDVVAAEALRAELAALPGGVDIVRPTTPTELAGIVAGFDAIAAYRMHALIAAYSFGVPALALSWDDKIDAFMASIGRADWQSDAADITSAEAAARLMDAARTGVDPVVHAQVLEEARRDVGLLYQALAGTQAARTAPAMARA